MKLKPTGHPSAVAIGMVTCKAAFDQLRSDKTDCRSSDQVYCSGMLQLRDSSCDACCYVAIFEGSLE